MGRHAIDLNIKVREVLHNTVPLIAEADRPLVHFESTANAGTVLLKYIDNHMEATGVYNAVYERHFGHLRRLILAELIQSFEQFLKALAAACIDFLAPYPADDRLDAFVPSRGDKLAAFVNAASLGRALCEPDTWLSNATINSRFAKLLKSPAGADWESLYPQSNHLPVSERPRASTLAVLWQIRHNLAHHVGVLTLSDSMKLRILSGGPVAVNCRLSPSADDIRFVKRFLSETAASTNRRVGFQLAAILTEFHRADPTLFAAQLKANELAQKLTIAVTVDGFAGVI